MIVLTQAYQPGCKPLKVHATSGTFESYLVTRCNLRAHGSWELFVGKAEDVTCRRCQRVVLTQSPRPPVPAEAVTEIG